MGMDKIKVLQRIADRGIIGIIRAASGQDAYEQSMEAFSGGIDLIEVALTTPDALVVIKRLRTELSDRAVIGAGTVIDPESARSAILSGAQFIIAPNINRKVITLCNRYGILVVPGIGTVTEVIEALEAGVDVVKAFPGSLLGPGFIKALHGPVPQAEIIPTGGVTMENIPGWFNAGALAVAVGSSLNKPKNGTIKEAAESFIKTVEKAKQ